MSIISKLKGDKKVEEEKQKGEDQKQSAQAQKRPTDTNRRSWTSEDMRQINRTTQPPVFLSRPGSQHSNRSNNRLRTIRSHGGFSQDWTPSQQQRPPPSLRAPSRNTSFQGLAKVIEDSHDSSADDIPPMPSIPARYSSSSLASSSKPRASQSPLSAGSSVGKSPLSSAG